MELIFSKKIHTETFPNAQENMDFDEALAQTILAKNNIETPHSTIRLYQWQKPGITLPKQRTLPTAFTHTDIGRRFTGGGIVFHCPGDLVLCTIIPINKHTPSPIKTIMSAMANQLQEALHTLNITTQTHYPTNAPQTIQFCNGYDNPYEIYVNSNKVVALAMKRIKTHAIIQGIVHLQSNSNHFHHIEPKFHPYLTHGLKGEISYDQYYQTLLSQIKKE